MKQKNHNEETQSKNVNHFRRRVKKKKEEIRCKRLTRCESRCTLFLSGETEEEMGVNALSKVSIQYIA